MTTTATGGSSEALGVGDLSTLSAFELGQQLSKIDAQRDVLSKDAVERERELGVLQYAAALNPENKEARAKASKAQHELKAVDRQLKALRERQSAIQSLIRCMNI